MALHVRFGDSSMANAQVVATDATWQWVQDFRRSAFRQDAARALACFAKRSGQHGLRPLIISDSPQVERIASRFGWLTTSSLGRAVHLGMRSPGSRVANTTTPGESSKVFLDWWVIANASRAMTFNDPPSSYFITARWFSNVQGFETMRTNSTTAKAADASRLRFPQVYSTFDLQECVSDAEVVAFAHTCGELCHFSS